MSTPPPGPPVATLPARAAAFLRTRQATLLPALFILLFAVVIVRKAWVCDDAYITFRTVDNFVNGYGLRWNPLERVQAYTHPLWLFLVSVFYAPGHEAFFTSIVLSVVVSLGAVALFAYRLAASPAVACLGLATLTASTAFTDYSTSGLENCLTHLLLALFLWEYLDARRVAVLWLFGSLLALNRLDALLLILPALALITLSPFSGRRLRAALLGLAPLLAWELFSLIYYGFLFPNTAYAKLNTGIDRLELAGRGLEYFLNSARADPLTLVAILIGATAPLLGWRERRAGAAVSAGIALYLLYTAWIGGDFMSGRFFTPPLFAAVALGCRSDLRSKTAWGLTGGVAAVLLLAPAYSQILRTGPRTLITPADAIDANGIADERAVYVPIASLRQARAAGPWPAPDAAADAENARPTWTSDRYIAGLKQLGVLDAAETIPAAGAGGQPRPVVMRYAIGYVGYYAGPGLHILDLNALADPLLARLPALEFDPMLPTFIPKLAPKKWRVGHYVRAIPSGYLETLIADENRIRDPHLAALYARLALITRGPLFEPRRLAAIWEINTGRYDRPPAR